MERALDVRGKRRCRSEIAMSLISLLFSLFSRSSFLNDFTLSVDTNPSNGRHHCGLRVSTPELCRSPADISVINESHQLGGVSRGLGNPLADAQDTGR